MGDLSSSAIRESDASSFLKLPAKERERRLAALSPEEMKHLDFSWEFWARPSQLTPPGDWRIWLIKTGRGWGKTRTAAEWIRAQVDADNRGRLALVAPTAADARDVMVEGESGVLNISPPWNRPKYEPSKRRLTWDNGAIATTYSADEPDRLRGPQHDAAWADEIAAWQYPEAWHMLMFGLRLGQNPQAVATTTPKPVTLVRSLMQAANVVVTHGATQENAANLAPEFLSDIINRYEGTRLYRQEIGGEYLDDFPGALWTRAMIDGARVMVEPDVSRLVVAVDPAVTSGDDSDETGIIVAAKGIDGHAYVLSDLTCRLSPDGWARRVCDAFENWSADRVVGEVNNGGDLVEQVIRTVKPDIPFTAVRASKAKQVRAEPIAALYEQGKVHHVGSFDTLEDQLVSFTPDGYRGGGSPDRADALVWALSELMAVTAAQGIAFPTGEQLGEARGVGKRRSPLAGMGGGGAIRG